MRAVVQCRTPYSILIFWFLHSRSSLFLPLSDTFMGIRRGLMAVWRISSVLSEAHPIHWSEICTLHVFLRDSSHVFSIFIQTRFNGYSKFIMRYPIDTSLRQFRSSVQANRFMLFWWLFCREVRWWSQRSWQHRSLLLCFMNTWRTRKMDALRNSRECNESKTYFASLVLAVFVSK